MTSQYDDLTSETASHVLHEFRAGGHPAGSYVTALMDAFSKADLDNFARLSLAYPGYAKAWNFAQHVRGGIGHLQNIAAGTFTCPKCKRTSHHPEDLKHGYCGACHAHTGFELNTDPALLTLRTH